MLLPTLWVDDALGAEAESQRRLPCDGVQLLERPLVISGIWNLAIGNLILEITGPLDDLAHCQAASTRQVAMTRGLRAASCEKRDVPAFRMRPKTAAKAARCLIDVVRRRHGVGGLEAKTQLHDSAKSHTRRMLQSGCFSHRCSGEPDLVSRVTAADYLPCSCRWTVAENLAWGMRRHATPAAIVDAWMDSPPHRETLLRPGLRDLGIAVRSGRPGARSAPGATFTANFGIKQ